MNFIILLAGKTFSFFSKNLNLGQGSTWPGHIALKFNPNFIKDTLGKSNTKVIIVAGTNGKTTTGRLVTSIIRESGKSYLQNKAGANLLNGLASALINGVEMNGELTKDYLVFESDENALPQVIEQTNPDYIICINLFRDQLDRYGEINSIAKKWSQAFKNLSSKTTLVLNADDPQITYLSKNTKSKVLYFGLDEKGSKKTKHGADSTYCPNCNYKLHFQVVFFSHLGIWNCSNCGFKRPVPETLRIIHFPLPGTYNKYNTLAAVLLAKIEDFDNDTVEKSFTNFTPAFGRQEELMYNGRSIRLFLSKNPTSFNESLQTINDLGGKDLLIVLNDGIPDGLDVSWIWDTNIEEIITNFSNIVISGERCFDMALMFKYAASSQFKIEPDFKDAINLGLKKTNKNQILYILPNYSAMLDVRKVLTGRKIL